MLKSKTSRWLAGPYLLWMAAFIVVPLTASSRWKT